MDGIGDLVVNLGVNNAPFTKGLSTASTQLKSFVGGVGSIIDPLAAGIGVNNAPLAKGLSTASSQLKSFVGGVGTILAPVAGALGAVWGVSSSISGYKESLAAQNKLSSVLKATGGAAGFTTAEISDYASELQSLTNFEDDATVGAAAMLAAFTNVRGDQFKGAIEQAMNLSTVMGGELSSNVSLLGKALNDPADGLTKLARAGVQFTESEKSQIEALQKSGDMIGAQTLILEKLENRFGGAAEAVADPWNQLTNAIGDVGESIGSLLLPSLNVVAQGLTQVVGFVGETIGSFQDMGIEAAVVLSHIGDISGISGMMLSLAFVQATEEASHFFTVALPEYFNWFADNWQNIFVTAAANTLTIFENLGSNIADVMTEIWNYIASGGTDQLEIAWKPLTDGFINTVEELPDIPERAISELETAMQSDIGAAMDRLNSSMQSQREQLQKQFSSTPLTATSFEPVDVNNDKKGKASKSLSEAAILGSQQAIKVALSGINKSTDPTLAVAKEQLKVQKDQLEVSKRQQQQQPVTEENIANF